MVKKLILDLSGFTSIRDLMVESEEVDDYKSTQSQNRTCGSP